MSGMFDQKQDKAKRKLVRTKQEEKANKKTRKTAIIVITVMLVLSISAMLLNSGFLRRIVPVVTIDGVSFSVAEFEYFFNSEYMDYINFLQQFQGMMGPGPDSGRPLSAQIHDPETGQTWADFVTQMTLERMTNLVSLYNAAIDAGFELSEEQLAEIEADIDMLEVQAMINQFPTTLSFLQQVFGTGMNERVFRDIQKFIALASLHSEHVRESFEFSPEELASYYDENRDELDVFNYRQFTVNMEYIDEEEFIDSDEYEAAREVAATDARFLAASIAERINSEDSFNAEAMGYSVDYMDVASTLRTVQGSRLDADAIDWFVDDSRTYGDVTIVDSENGSNIILFISRDDNNYRTAGMRQILISSAFVDPEEFELGEDDPEYMLAVEHAENEAHERAELVRSLFIAEGEDEAALTSLLEEHSDDRTEGGYYPYIAKFSYRSSYINVVKLVPEIEQWLFDENRVTGDWELIFTEAFGYHLVYFTGFGELFFELMVDDILRTESHTEWVESLPLGEPVRYFSFILVHT